MDAITSHPLASLFAITAVVSYLNAKFAIGSDLRDIRHARDFARRKQRRVACAKRTHSLYEILEQSGAGDGDDAIWFESKTKSYGQLKKGMLVFSNISYQFSFCYPTSRLVETAPKVDQLAGLLHARSIKTGDVVAVFMTNSPEMVVTILALSKLGAVASLINTNLRNDTLIYALDRSKPIYILSTPDLAQHMSETLQDTTRSGHTPHSPLPLFHGTAFLAGLCYNLGSAGTLCLARKFSASSFWKDATECRANRILYVGELCRYLLATPTSSYDRSHSVTHAFGNGLRADVWEKFREHFGIEEIREIYRATEGIAKFDNHGRSAAGAGKIGFAGPIKRYLEDVTFVVKYDPETQMPVRDPKTGFCIKADLGEEGEVIGRVLNLKLLSNYLNDDAATEKKLLRDVFRKGDLYQRMGDLVIHEESWWVRFQERVGDTFRWKGENVSAGEVTGHICLLPNVMDAAVFGVKLDGYYGTAGGAIIVLHSRTEASEDEFINSLGSALAKRGVPSCALPRLVRMTNSIAAGDTFKQAKTIMERLSWNPNSVPPPEVKSGGEEEYLEEQLQHDTLYWFNPAKGYRRMDARAWSGIERGTVKL
ncbi:acyl-CoA synthetase [Blastomyces dermatitidis ER-3]|uniref:Acyl-CoA synthetase n=2 Tax=Ajellomyces dermatitidis TaxID=5039 RepID=F2TPM7_AJEDA|nr:acyl-CoA synthetase [Blastomyces dermatitidis ER-3]EEQ91281.1 acyl-CoA synthetase [Blastomyces dermatitidis ER-3]EGE85190.2 acyl-CoA synthetase [Blastomyces dermatitidis ATCC 18188]